MGSNSVFNSLQELFPQVDVRILKAVAIEHSKDIDAAVESILFEVLPAISSSKEELPSADKHGGAVEQKQTFWLGPQEAVEETNADLPSETRSISFEVASRTDHTNDKVSIKSTCSDGAVASSLVVSSHSVNNLEELFLANNKEGSMPSAEFQEVSLLDASHYGSFAVPSYMTCETRILSDGCNNTSHFNIQELNGDIAHDSPSFTCREDRQGHPCLGTGSPKGDKLLTALQSQLPVPDDNQDSMSSKALNNSFNGFKDSGSCSLESDVECIVFENHMGEAIDKSLRSAIATQSGQIVGIDFLEEFISDVKNNKKALLVAMEFLLDKAREVELKEKAAEQAKEETSRIGMAIVAEVENLKQMVHQAKETYEMHAGEVFGEKAILATEARELQARLLHLSSERDKSLSIIDEIHQNLEQRMAAAEAEKVAAENEKLEKEESASKALDAQVVIFEKMVQESEKLQQEAEENAKLREFLMDQGRAVDALQGEIAVICEDVKLLKERINGCLPISRSLLSSQISTSSSISSKRASPDIVTDQAESSDSLKALSHDHSPNGEESRNMKSSESQKTSVDGEWVFFFKDDAE